MSEAPISGNMVLYDVEELDSIVKLLVPVWMAYIWNGIAGSSMPDDHSNMKFNFVGSIIAWSFSGETFQPFFEMDVSLDMSVVSISSGTPVTRLIDTLLWMVSGSVVTVSEAVQIIWNAPTVLDIFF